MTYIFNKIFYASIMQVLLQFFFLLDLFKLLKLVELENIMFSVFNKKVVVRFVKK